MLRMRYRAGTPKDRRNFILRAPTSDGRIVFEESIPCAGRRRDRPFSRYSGDARVIDFNFFFTLIELFNCRGGKLRVTNRVFGN